MILKPQISDLKVIGHYLGRIMIGFGLVMIIPAIFGFLLKEYDPALDFVIGAGSTIIFGFVLSWSCFKHQELRTMHGLTVVAVSWLVATLFGAAPLFLSGHYKSFLDACFEVMSGLTTTGLTLVQDLDHLSLTHNLWRHLGPFLGGQGIIVIAISLFFKGGQGIIALYFGEARDEKLVPNIINTARFIWLISIVYLIIGTIALSVTGISIGLKPASAFFHGLCIFMAGFDTAGFAPQSQNLLYYHSFAFEIVTIIIMIMGAFNFNLHYQLWIGNKKELWKNIETRTFLLSIMLTFFIVAVGLSKTGIYPNAASFLRKGFFQLISGHTTTGYMNIYAQQFISDWGGLALVGLILAMAVGGCVCSTAGGIKMFRVGIFLKAIREDIKKTQLPPSAVFYQKFHHVKGIFLEDKLVRSVLIITLSYLILYGVGAIIGMFYGYPFLESTFESVSAVANVGLSCGITDASMPIVLKVVYIIQMWAGRLEFMSVFALFGFIMAAIKGR